MSYFYGFNFAATSDPMVAEAQGLLNTLALATGASSRDESGNLLVVDGIWSNHSNAAFANLYRMLGRLQPGKLTPDVIQELRDVLAQRLSNPGSSTPPPPGGKPPASNMGLIAAIVFGGLAVVALASNSTPKE
jgi:hypothetical protein